MLSGPNCRSASDKNDLTFWRITSSKNNLEIEEWTWFLKKNYGDLINFDIILEIDKIFQIDDKRKWN